jgi:hypothetical protein
MAVTLQSKAGTSCDLGVPLTSFEFFLEPLRAGNMRSLRCQEDSEQLFGLGAVMALALKLSEPRGGACAGECNARQ